MAECTSGSNLTILVLHEREYAALTSALRYYLDGTLDDEVEDILQAMEG